jgi:cell division protein FtsW (lipid II flippase)
VTLSLVLVLLAVVVLALAIASVFRKENGQAVILAIIGVVLLVFSGVHW